MTTFTKNFMRQNCGCYSESKLNACSFMKQDEITLKSIFRSEIPLKDKIWFYCFIVATREQNQQLAIKLAEIALPIYEARYPIDKRPPEAIVAAKQYLAGRISLSELTIKMKNAAIAGRNVYKINAFDEPISDAAYAAAYAASAATVVDGSAANDAYSSFTDHPDISKWKFEALLDAIAEGNAF